MEIAFVEQGDVESAVAELARGEQAAEAAADNDGMSLLLFVQGTRPVYRADSLATMAAASGRRPCA